MHDRFIRNVEFFGEAGQASIRQSHCTVVGVGGLGTQVVPQLALLGVGKLSLVDSEELSESNRNRYFGAWHDDSVPGSPKVELARRLVAMIDPMIEVEVVKDSLVSEAAFHQVHECDYVFGCLDSEGARLVLTELSSAYETPYIDLATEVIPGERSNFGGRVFFSNGQGCLVCMGVLDQQEAARDLEGDSTRGDREAVYGVDQDALGTSGPSVVSLNGIIASHGVNEFMVVVTGLRPPERLLTFYGMTGKVTASVDSPPNDCWLCRGLWGTREQADVERYIRDGVGDRLR